MYGKASQPTANRILHIGETSWFPGVVVHWDVHILDRTMPSEQLPQVITPEKKNGTSHAPVLSFLNIRRG